ncbi:MAG: hypothetical protein JRI67_09885 [Deltaproteobacteria bacterium]|nr:hypothetical protein [Deltaproteobacteria bacterium]
MKIEEIPTTIERIWDFIVPSILEIIASFIILMIIVGSAPLFSLSNLLTPYLNTLKDPAVINLLSAYGIIKLTPILLLLGLLIFAYAFHKFSHAIGGSLPITLAWNHYAMMARRVSSSLVADVWQYYPNIASVSDLHRIIDDRLERAKFENDPLFATAIFFEKRFNKLHEHLDFLHFLIFQAAVTIVLGIVLTSLSWKSLFIYGLGVILSLLVIYAFLVWQQFKYLWQLEFWRVFNTRTSLQAQMQKPVQPDALKRSNLQKQCEEGFKDAKKDNILIPYCKWR